MVSFVLTTDQDTWSLDFKNCSGKSQSPINIDTRAAIFTSALPPIVLQGYDLSDEEKLTLQNNGHTCKWPLGALLWKICHNLSLAWVFFSGLTFKQVMTALHGSKVQVSLSVECIHSTAVYRLTGTAVSQVKNAVKFPPLLKLHLNIHLSSL